MHILKQLSTELLDALSIKYSLVNIEQPIEYSDKPSGVLDLSETIKATVTLTEGRKYPDYMHTLQGKIGVYDGVSYGYNHIDIINPSNELLNSLKNVFRTSISFHIVKDEGIRTATCVFCVSNTNA